MEITYFDIFFLGFIFISAMLAMTQGIFSELISLTNWIGSAIITYYLYPYFLIKIAPYFTSKKMAIIAIVIPLFLAILTIISILLKIITNPIHIRSVFLDKILGFLFGGVRGLLLLVIATSFWNLIVGDSKEPAWIQNSQSKKILDILEIRLRSAAHTIKIPHNPYGS
ncbi:MAG: CvpA family protein [Candidatus Liberibacter ctenarytainae]|uniref:CvpA family protein n=1 Tax=Candidatus Liberibacter ctenarytainae TaxID=2020335 RepID=A0A937AI80_9HYPH|nr:CvpA family protein [Candidatus Liberibacter ctenarytainae]